MYGKDFTLRCFEDYDATKAAFSHSPFKENSSRKLCNNLVLSRITNSKRVAFNLSRIKSTVKLYCRKIFYYS